MNIQVTHTVEEDGTTVTEGTVDDKPYRVITAPGILPPFSTKCTGENIMWNVKPTWKADMKGGSGGVYVAPKGK